MSQQVVTNVAATSQSAEDGKKADAGTKEQEKKEAENEKKEAMVLNGSCLPYDRPQVAPISIYSVTRAEMFQQRALVRML